MIYFPTNWGAKEPRNLPNHRVVIDLYIYIIYIYICMIFQFTIYLEPKGAHCSLFDI